MKKKKRLNGFVNDFPVDYKSVLILVILSARKFLIKKHNIK